MNSMPGNGFLRVWITKAGGTLPVQGVPVQIRDGNGTLLHVLRTGESGLTPPVSLPAPAAADSLQPNGNAIPYAVYTVSVEMAGYGSVRELRVPVFDGVTALQPVTLLPETETDRPPEQPYLVYPEALYGRLRQGSTTPADPLEPQEGQRPLGNIPDSEEIPDTPAELFWDDNDLPDYGRGHA